MEILEKDIYEASQKVKELKMEISKKVFLTKWFNWKDYYLSYLRMTYFTWMNALTCENINYFYFE